MDNFSMTIDSMSYPERAGADPWIERVTGTLMNVVPWIFMVIGILGFLGNVMVLLVMFYNKMMRTVTNILILNLAITDLLFITLSLPFTALDYYHSSWTMSDFVCRLDQYIYEVTAAVSIYIVVIMSAMRYIAVCHPLLSVSFGTTTNTIAFVSWTWLLVCVVFIPTLALFSKKHYDYNGTQYASCEIGNKQAEFAYYVWSFSFSFAIPIILLVGLYTPMLIKLWTGELRSASHAKTNSRATRIVVAIVLLFVVCWLPFRVINLLSVS